MIKTQILRESDIKTLFDGDVCALYLEGYTHSKLSRDIAKWFSTNIDREGHPHEIRSDDGIEYLDYGVDRVGVSYHTTYGRSSESPEWKHYYDNSLRHMRTLREAFPNAMTPIDRFRLEFDEVWPKNVNLASFDNRKMFTGIGRIMNASKSHIVEENPHVDAVPERLAHLKGQFSINFYLSVPDEGGELQLWDVPVLSMDEIENLPPDLHVNHKTHIIKPNVGDAIIFNTRKPHAIRSFSSGERITLQSFIGLRHDDSVCLWV